MSQDELAPIHNPREEEEERLECANCGTYGEGLLRCSRCKLEWFCSLKCHKAYWPVHKEFCRPCEFADSIDDAEPRFARWMRRHGKLAVLKDAQVDRLERASQGRGPSSRQEVMQDMYGRVDPQPRAPSYSPQEVEAVRRLQGQAAAQARLRSAQDRAYAEVAIPAGLGLDAGHYKWRQSQSHVEAHVRLPGEGAGAARKVHVQLTASHLAVSLGSDDTLLAGPLYAAVVPHGSTWYVDVSSGLLVLSLLKASRRGHYPPGHTNADTFWRSLLRNAPQQEVLQAAHPPSSYYWSPYEDDDMVGRQLASSGSRARSSRLASGAAQPKLLAAC